MDDRANRAAPVPNGRHYGPPAPHGRHYRPPAPLGLLRAYSAQREDLHGAPASAPCAPDAAGGMPPAEPPAGAERMPGLAASPGRSAMVAVTVIPRRTLPPPSAAMRSTARWIAAWAWACPGPCPWASITWIVRSLPFSPGSRANPAIS